MRGNFITDRNGCKNPNYKDGRKNTRLYGIYNCMISRCYNNKSTGYNRYGGRGITVCDDWLKDYANFYNWAINNGYKENVTIDRINNDGNYNPDNCRWVTRKIQSRNQSRNKIITINTETHCLIEWCEIYKINYKTVRDRLKRGWGIEKALTEEVQIKFRKK